MNHASALTRRRFLTAASLTAIGALEAPYFLPAAVTGASRKLNVASIGAGGRGSSNTDSVTAENLIALCDVDVTRTAGAKHPQARRYTDFRVLLEKEAKNLDAVVISTPDHTHAPAAIMAMKLGKHVYCEKPLSHFIFETRMMRQVAREQKVVTQMGNQGSAEDGLRRGVELIQAGIIGNVSEAHVWSNRPIWPQGLERPDGEDPVPAGLDWDLWLGPAPFRPYKTKTYHPFNWRTWFDFGSGAIGDMGCHILNLPFRALKLGYPTVVECESASDSPKESYPRAARIRFEFPAREGLPPCKLWWYDGNPENKEVPPRRPPSNLTREVAALNNGQVSANGFLLIGDKGKLFSANDFGAKSHLLLKGESEFMPSEKHEATQVVRQSISRLASNSKAPHMAEWLAACRGGPATYSNFEIGGMLTEIILLGCLALRVGSKLEWDGPNMRAKNTLEAAQYVRREYREGWRL